ncbi:phosphotransferase enzyme family protein [Burkholderia plantarii]|uniref:phosphotransferase enzyme family protein n=1 Tax=Burkholderia plantarii TaxID=41899 RepID=UPI0014958BBF|nr:aminoglycoside phosphotransferase family protein [Burkholderia plantarii]
MSFFGISYRKLERIKGANNSLVYLSDCTDFGKIVVKIFANRERYFSEVDAIIRLSGLDVIPELIGHGEFSAEMYAVVLSWLPGISSENLTWDAGIAREVGATLARLHLWTRDDQKSESGGADKWKSSFCSDMHARLEMCRSENMPFDFDSIQNRLVTALASVTDCTPFCLTHQDFHAGNVLLYKNKVSGIVDFEYSCYAPFFLDLTYVYGGLFELCERSRLEFLDSYFKKFEITGFDVDILHHFSLFKSIACLSWCLKMGKAGGPFFLKNLNLVRLLQGD